MSPRDPVKQLHSIAIALGVSVCAAVTCSPPHPGSRQLGTLTGITDPHSVMWAHEDLLFVTNADNEEQRRDTLFVYSLDDLSLLGTIGGPGTFRIQPVHSIEIFLQPDRFVVNSSGKVSVYGYDLGLLTEFEHEGSTYFYEPFGDNLIAREIYREDDIDYYRLNLYDADLSVIRELCRKEFEGKAFSGDFSKKVYEDGLYVAGRTDDFLIEVFDRDGSIVRRIEYDHDRVEVTERHRNEHMNNLLSRPGWERYFSNRTEMEEYYRGRIIFPDHLPAIQMIQVHDDRIYVLTNAQRGETREMWILDLQGELLERKMVPFRMRTALLWYPFTVHRGHMYQLLPNDATGRWEVVQTKIL
jgi:hypothetical protein